jgi:hypothetical protein
MQGLGSFLGSYLVYRVAPGQARVVVVGTDTRALCGGVGRKAVPGTVAGVQLFAHPLLHLLLGGEDGLQQYVLQISTAQYSTIQGDTASVTYTVYTVYKTLCPNGNTWKDKSQPQKQGEVY